MLQVLGCRSGGDTAADRSELTVLYERGGGLIQPHGICKIRKAAYVSGVLPRYRIHVPWALPWGWNNPPPLAEGAARDDFY